MDGDERKSQWDTLVPGYQRGPGSLIKEDRWNFQIKDKIGSYPLFGGFKGNEVFLSQRVNLTVWPHEVEPWFDSSFW